MKNFKGENFNLEMDLNEDVNLYDKIPIREVEEDEDKQTASPCPKEKEVKCKMKDEDKKNHSSVMRQTCKIHPKIELELYFRLKTYLLKNKVSMSLLISDLIKNYLDKYEKK